MMRESPPPGGASPILAAQRDHKQSTATAAARAEALAIDLSALAAGVWLPTREILDALVLLARANAWDLRVESDLRLAS
jgi:hypothetical protein